MKQKNLFILIGILIFIVIGYFATMYLAGAFYHLAIKVMPESLSYNTWITLWDQLHEIPTQKKKLQGSLIFAGAICYLFPILVITELTRKTRALHGSARFANSGEVRKAGLDGEKGIIVGRYQGRYLIFDGQQFVLVAAPTRSGKGVGIVIPNLLNWPDSCVVLDVKLENYEKTSGFRAAHGQEVYLFNPFATDFKTCRWNPLSSVSRDQNYRIGDIQAIAAVFYPTDHTVKEPFWNEQAQNLFLGIALYLLETPELPFTLGEILRQGSGYGKSLDKHLKEIIENRSNGDKPLSRPCIDALNRFISNSESTASSIKSSFDAPLGIFANPIVDAATSGDDFSLKDVRRKKMSIYFGIQPNRLKSASRLINLFFSQLVNLNTDELPEKNPDLKYQCLSILDEFTAMGRVSIIAETVSFLAGYNIRLLPIIQSYEQLEEYYGKESARNFIKNHDLKIVFPPDDIEDAERVSKTLGTFTEKAVSHGNSRSPMQGIGSNVTRSENTSDQRRALMLPQELREMPQDEQIIIKSHTKPILCQKVRYYEEEIFTNRLMPPKEVQAIDISLHIAKTEQMVRPLEKDEIQNIDLSTIAINTDSIADFVGDPENPTQEEVTAVVDSFFSQLGWEEEPTNEITSERPAEKNTAGLIDLSILQI